MRTGILGGTFDPPHLGHLILAMEAQRQLSLDRILWVLTPDPPHKQGQTMRPWQQRMEMLMRAVSGNPDFMLSRVDLDRPGPQYAVDTVRILKQKYPDNEWIYLLGGDSLRDLPKWHAPADLINEISALGVMRRVDATIDMEELERTLPGITAKTCFVDAPLVEISSTEIRRRAEAGEAYRYFVPEAVYHWIEEYHIYHA